jgi:FdhD protein
MGITTDVRPTTLIVDGVRDQRGDQVVVEAPVTFVIDQVAVAMTMRTPGHDLELAAGWLVSEGVVRRSSDISQMGAYATSAAAAAEDIDTVRITLAEGISGPRQRAFITNSSCGICSSEAIESFEGPWAALRTPPWKLSTAEVPGLIEGMRAQQRMFDLTGALHAAAIAAPDGSLVVVREDVGRHNAVDKVIGHCVLNDRLPLTDHLLVVSGRISYEIVMKALRSCVAGIVAVSGPTTMAVDLARANGLLLVGFARDNRMNIYSGQVDA